MSNFKFELEEKVKLKISAESGKVIGRAEHSNTSNQYQVHYLAADGRAVESWWFEDDIEASDKSMV